MRFLINHVLIIANNNGHNLSRSAANLFSVYAHGNIADITRVA